MFSEPSQHWLIGKALRKVFSTDATIETQFGAKHAGQPICAPHISILDLSTIEEFSDCVRAGHFDDGTFERMLVVRNDGPQHARWTPIDPHIVPSDIVDTLRGLWCGGNVSAQDCSNNASRPPNWVTIPWENDAVKAAYYANMEAIEHRMDNYLHQDTFLARTAEIGLRLATIVAGGQNNLKPSISMADLEWGNAVALWSAEEMIRIVGRAA